MPSSGVPVYLNTKLAPGRPIVFLNFTEKTSSNPKSSAVVAGLPPEIKCCRPQGLEQPAPSGTALTAPPWPSQVVVVLQESIARLQEQSHGLQQRVAQHDAEAKEAAKNVGMVKAQEAEIGRLMHEIAQLRDDAEGHRENKAAFAAAAQRQQDMEQDLERLRAELQGRDKALGRAEDALQENLAKASAAHEKHQEALEQLREQLGAVEVPLLKPLPVPVPHVRVACSGPQRHGGASTNVIWASRPGRGPMLLSSVGPSPGSTWDPSAPSIPHQQSCVDSWRLSQSASHPGPPPPPPPRSELSRGCYAQPRPLSMPLPPAQGCPSHETEVGLSPVQEPRCRCLHPCPAPPPPPAPRLTLVQGQRNAEAKSAAELSARLLAAQENLSAKEGELRRVQEAAKERDADTEKARDQSDRLAEQLRQAEVAAADLRRQLQQSHEELQQQHGRVAKLETVAGEGQAEVKQLMALMRDDASEMSRLRQALRSSAGALRRALVAHARPQRFFRTIKTQEGGGPPPKPPPQTKVTIAGKNEIYNWENQVRPFLVHQVLGPKPPPPLPPPCPSPLSCLCQGGRTAMGRGTCRGSQALRPSSHDVSPANPPFRAASPVTDCHRPGHGSGAWADRFAALCWTGSAVRRARGGGGGGHKPVAGSHCGLTKQGYTTRAVLGPRPERGRIPGTHVPLGKTAPSRRRRFGGRGRVGLGWAGGLIQEQALGRGPPSLPHHEAELPDCPVPRPSGLSTATRPHRSAGGRKIPSSCV